MGEEAVVEEIHGVRREIAAQFNDDVHAFFEYLRQREAQRPEAVVSLDRVVREPASAVVAGSAAKNDGGG